MYVCLCHGISDKKIMDAQNSGVSSLSELQRSCPIGTNCGACVPFVKKMLRQKSAAQGTSTETTPQTLGNRP